MGEGWNKIFEIGGGSLIFSLISYGFMHFNFVSSNMPAIYSLYKYSHLTFFFLSMIVSIIGIAILKIISSTFKIYDGRL